MPSAPACPQGHHDGLVVHDGVLLFNGLEKDRYRCQSPNGSYHRFLGPAVDSEAGGSALDDEHSGADVGARASSLGWDASDLSPRQSHASVPEPRSARGRSVQLSGSRAWVAVRDRPPFGSDATVMMPPVPPTSRSRPAPPTPRGIPALSACHVPSSSFPRRPPTRRSTGTWALRIAGSCGSALPPDCWCSSASVRFAADHPVTWAFLALVLLRLVTTAVGLLTSSRRRRGDGLDHETRVAAWQPAPIPASTCSSRPPASPRGAGQHLPPRRRSSVAGRACGCTSSTTATATRSRDLAARLRVQLPRPPRTAAG